MKSCYKTPFGAQQTWRRWPWQPVRNTIQPLCDSCRHRVMCGLLGCEASQEVCLHEELAEYICVVCRRGVRPGMPTRKCHGADDAPSLIFRIATCGLNCIPTCLLLHNRVVLRLSPAVSHCRVIAVSST